MSTTIALILFIIFAILLLFVIVGLFIEILPELKEGAKESTDRLKKNLDEYFDQNLVSNFETIRKKKN